jgi:hypothetical protein
VEASSTDDDGEYYAMAMAEVKLAGLAPVDAMIVIPLTISRVDQSLDLTFAASADCMYDQLHVKPQARCTYGHCVAYFADAQYRPLDIGARFSFARIASYIVAPEKLATSVRATRGIEANLTTGAADKRQCVRPLVELVGELADEAGAKNVGIPFRCP